MEEPAIAVFTGKSVERLLQDGGSGSWVLNPKNARPHRYVVCVRNQHGTHAGGEEAHGSAFLVGTISGFDRLGSEKGVERWRIQFDRYALIDRPDVWNNRRNPVRYTTLGELGIDPTELDFQPAPAPAGASADREPEPARAVRKLTIAEAKEGLAAMLGVSLEAIEITIKG